MGNLLQLKMHRPGSRKDAGFTLAEVIVAAGILAFFICGSLVANTQMNQLAAVARMRTLAMAVAQQRVDEIMTVPWGVATARPTVLVAGTTTQNNIPLDDDSFNTQTGLSSSFTNLDIRVLATRTTQITNVTTRQVRAVVTVTYVLRSKTYSVSLTTLRTTDTI